MRKWILALAALAPASAFAVDGVVLINQSTVLAAGGFPYRITQPGSYRLSGNLEATMDQAAIVIDADHVALDLNGFTVQCTLDAVAASTNNFACIREGAAVHGPAIRNGAMTVTASLSPPSVIRAFYGLLFASSDGITLEDLHLDFKSVDGVLPLAIQVGPHSIIRHDIFTGGPAGGPGWACPSLLEGNVNAMFGEAPGGPNCVLVNNVGLF